MKKKIFKLIVMLAILIYATLMLGINQGIGVWLNILLLILSTLTTNDAIHDVLAARKEK